MSKAKPKLIINPFYIGKEKAETVIKRVIEDEVRKNLKNPHQGLEKPSKECYNINSQFTRLFHLKEAVVMKQPSEIIYNAALYLRLSKEDGLDNMESSSIQTQKEMLTRYCRENGIAIVDYYIDDGYSGTNFERPAFKRMIGDIEEGKVNCVITKDLSRLGRNYLESGAYTEIFFPEHNVRYIALNDGVDTLRAASMEITPFRNLLNDMYAKDISNKVRSALLTRQKQGKFIGNKAPFGYRKDPNDKNHLIIDENYAPVVRRIFEMSKSGMGVNVISKQLRKEKIPRPAYAAKDVIPGYGRFVESDEQVYDWTHDSVRAILTNPVYAGHLRGQVRTKLSIKSKMRRNNGALGEFVIENCHEPIIDPADWEVVQRLIKSRRCVRAEGVPKYDNIFSGLLKCDCCGYSLITGKNASRISNPTGNFGYRKSSVIWSVTRKSPSGFNPRAGRCYASGAMILRKT